MKDESKKLTKFSFAKTFVLPALLVFLIPVLALLFFLHAQERYDAQVRAGILQEIQADTSLSEEDRTQAIALFTNVPFSRMITDDNFASLVTPKARFDYGTFRWMIRISILSIAAGILVFMWAGVCVWLSLRSQYVQYVSLKAGWYVLRIYGALQTAVIGVLILALSFWVTALWFKFYSVKLILIAGLAALIGIAAVVVAIFRNPKNPFVIEGKVLDRSEKIPLWAELQSISNTLGTDPPDQVIAGIDDNFFVTEMPVTIDGKEYRGKTLFVSLALLKHLAGSEARAILAHEMAHFSGQDTLYSKKITPLLTRYGSYLHGLYNNVITKPVFYFMYCFRALFEWSLTRLSRTREFRADEIAAQTTSSRDMASALLRVAAYSNFRQKVQADLFQHEQALEAADISARIAQGFKPYALAFGSDPSIGDLQTPHPFDSHPPLSQRLAARGYSLVPETINELLAVAGDGAWTANIPQAEQMEQEQWQAFEDRFRSYHEQTLPYRFLPETDAEREIVVKAFPSVSFESSTGALSLDHEKVHHASWDFPVRFGEIKKCELNEDGTLKIQYERGGNQSCSIKTKKFPQSKELLAAFQGYYARYLSARDYQKHKATEVTSASKQTATN